MGNKNSGRKDKFTREALMMEMKERERGNDPRGMRKLASKVWDLAEEGERWAAEFIRDTMDGKPAQTIAGDPDNPLEVIGRITREVVSAKPDNPDR